MAFNWGSSTGGVSSPSAWNSHVIYNNAVNFGDGGIVQGDISTGNIDNNQESIAEGGTTSQTASADFKMDMPGMDGMEGMGGMGGMGGGKGGKHLLLLMNLNGVQLQNLIVAHRPSDNDEYLYY